MEWLLGISGVGSLAIITWLVYKLVRSKDEIINAHDVIAAKDVQIVSADSAREVAEARLKIEQDLRASAESQRNDAWKEAREHAVEIIRTSGIADAVTLGNRILSAPLPVLRGVPPLPKARLSDSGDTALEKP